MIARANEAKAVGAEDAAGMEDRTVSDGHVIVDCDVGMQDAVVADADAFSD